MQTDYLTRAELRAELQHMCESIIKQQLEDFKETLLKELVMKLRQEALLTRSCTLESDTSASSGTTQPMDKAEGESGQASYEAGGSAETSQLPSEEGQTTHPQEPAPVAAGQAGHGGLNEEEHVEDEPAAARAVSNNGEELATVEPNDSEVMPTAGEVEPSRAEPSRAQPVVCDVSFRSRVVAKAVREGRELYEVSAVGVGDAGERITGYYVQTGNFEGRKKYSKVPLPGVHFESSFLYFWDESDESGGWWFGSTVGGDEAWCRNPSRSEKPPRDSWMDPFESLLLPQLIVTLVAAAAENPAPVEAAQETDTTGPPRLTADRLAAHTAAAEQAAAKEASHEEGSCRPCYFFHQTGHCNKGDACKYCHFPHDCDAAKADDGWREETHQAAQASKSKPKKQRKKKAKAWAPPAAEEQWEGETYEEEPYYEHHVAAPPPWEQQRPAFSEEAYYYEQPPPPPPVKERRSADRRLPPAQEPQPTRHVPLFWQAAPPLTPQHQQPALQRDWYQPQPYQMPSPGANPGGAVFYQLQVQPRPEARAVHVHQQPGFPMPAHPLPAALCHPHPAEEPPPYVPAQVRFPGVQHRAR